MNCNFIPEEEVKIRRMYEDQEGYPVCIVTASDKAYLVEFYTGELMYSQNEEGAETNINKGFIRANMDYPGIRQSATCSYQEMANKSRPVWSESNGGFI